MTKYCPGCGAKLNDWFVFCDKCGIQIGDSPEPEYEPNYELPEEPIYEQQFPQGLTLSDAARSELKPKPTKNEFLAMLDSIEKDFDPRILQDKDDFKRQMIKFLHVNFTNEIQEHGHTSIGGEVDIVIDGTYALKLKIIKNEGGLIFLVDQIMEYQRDFHDCAVILADVGELTVNKIKEYLSEYKELGVKAILKKAWIKQSEEEKEALNIQWPS